METIKLLEGCKNVKFEGLWRDPEGQYSIMPIFELTEPPAEEWNRRARELREERARMEQEGIYDEDRERDRKRGYRL